MSRSNNIRLFISLRPDALALKAWENFKSAAPTWPVRWTPLDQAHITLKFLGETSPENEPKIVEVLKKSALNKETFSLQLKGGGVFPPKGSPAIFWAGVEGNIKFLQKLAAEVNEACAALGYSLEKREFHPHLTVARIRSEKKEDKNLRWLRPAYQEWISKFESPVFTVSEMTLMQSHLTPQGSRYTERARIDLTF